MFGRLFRICLAELWHAHLFWFAGAVAVIIVFLGADANSNLIGRLVWQGAGEVCECCFLRMDPDVGLLRL